MEKKSYIVVSDMESGVFYLMSTDRKGRGHWSPEYPDARVYPTKREATKTAKLVGGEVWDK